MAWMCSGKTNDELVNNLVKGQIISAPQVISAMRAVDRAHFTKCDPYADSPQGIGFGATISAPHMHGYALEELQQFLQPGMCALDVGSGSGYLTACMAKMVGSSGYVVGVEHISELAEQSRAALQAHYPEWIDSRRVEIVTGDGRKGYINEAPYDCIHVGAASPVKPVELLAQLMAPGRMFVPVGSGIQYIVVYDKDARGNITEEMLMGVRYVPLTDAPAYNSG
ncbi:hypothetical protein GGI04_002440 [Coemansia thaxteri]|uniref:Protein-L-isoaspartate O-methyltransferase n=1 Tax=Coemansia thaxteri TaxID=2663907 RepID=A0A9W8BL23_9FUNG|nr:hypothetical protein H4R26_002399 [Coemansia thaxteri]KAJ2004893.1 hypothetical protein GGI04_002440 [Coemansia thaxteri]KAJ2470969.1 hypothetical protein GGI02_002584 [Coemansia sp. RSA 2322]KAJ2484601.1 hypothetical protein EV174_002309 [Coemansia sp. RSA 2320]